MATKNTDEKKEFTHYKLYTVVLNKLGVECACVHAVIANASQNGYSCELSDSTIGNYCHLSYKVVAKARRKLLESGFIVVDTTTKTKYGTYPYKYVPSMVDHGLKPDDMDTLPSNDNRYLEHIEELSNEDMEVKDKLITLEQVWKSNGEWSHFSKWAKQNGIKLPCIRYIKTTEKINEFCSYLEDYSKVRCDESSQVENYA